MDVAGTMRRAAQYYSDHEAVVHGPRRYSFAQAWERGVRLANGLIAMGLAPGDRVGVLEGNSIEAADFFLATAIANLVRVPLYPRNSREAQHHMLGHTNCRLAVVSAAHAEELDGLVDELADLNTVFVRDEGYEDWLSQQSDIDPMLAIDGGDIFIIRHTGGTTGMGKGVAYSQKAWLDTARDWFYLFLPVEPGDACLHLGPISHGSGYQFLPIWLGGGRNVMLDHFHPGETMDVMEREGINYLFVVPTMLTMLHEDQSVGSRDFSKLKCMLVSAAPISDATALRAHEIFGDTLYQGYGQTEILPLAMMGPRQWFAKIEGCNPLRACGMPLPYAEVQIWDEDNKPLPLGETGEIVGRSDGQMTGFWNNPEASAERIVDGWIKTGDIGYLDTHGYLYMTDRADDMILSGGHNIWPAELENVIANHPDVIEVAVFGIPDEKWGATPMAVCTVREGARRDPEEIIGLCAEALGSYMKPSKVEFRSEPLPKSPVGKIRRKDLREPHWQGHDRRVV